MGNSKFCPHCGASLADNATFCGSCGQRLQPVMPADAGQQGQQMPPAANRRVRDEGFEENFFKTEGRLNRLRYFKRILVIDIFTAILSAILEGIAGEGSSVEYLVTFIDIVTLPMLYTLDVRRLHDMGKSEAMAQQVLVLSAVVYVANNFIVSASGEFDTSSPWSIALIAMSLLWCVYNLYFLFAEGNRGSNSYGPDPLER